MRLAILRVSVLLLMDSWGRRVLVILIGSVRRLIFLVG